MTDAPNTIPFGQEKCPYCAAAISMHEKIHPGHCGAQTCFETHIIKGAAKRRAERVQEYRDKITAARQQFPETLGGAQAVAVVPHQDGALTPLPAARLADFTAHLDAILAIAFDPAQVLDSERDRGETPPVPPELAAAGCATCQGSCCRQGGGEGFAFLTAASLRAVMQTAHDCDAQTLRAQYLSALPERSVTGSCVYHSAQGCTLGRGWRANKCNSFHCYELNQMAVELGDAVDGPVLLVGVADGAAQKVMAYDPATGITPLATDT